MKNGDLAAFAQGIAVNQDNEIMTTDYYHESAGLTKREYFAGLAMQGLAANPDLNETAGKCAELSLRLADALLKALEVSDNEKP